MAATAAGETGDAQGWLREDVSRRWFYQLWLLMTMNSL